VDYKHSGVAVAICTTRAESFARSSTASKKGFPCKKWITDHQRNAFDSQRQAHGHRKDKPDKEYAARKIVPFLLAASLPFALLQSSTTSCALHLLRSPSNQKLESRLPLPAIVVFCKVCVLQNTNGRDAHNASSVNMVHAISLLPA